MFTILMESQNSKTTHEVVAENGNNIMWRVHNIETFANRCAIRISRVTVATLGC